MSTIGLIVAAGHGTRIGADLPKQYLTVAGRPLLRRTVEALASSKLVDAIRVVISPSHRERYQNAVGDLDLLEPIAGGETRQASVRSGLESLSPIAPDRVLVHDGARPFVDPALIARVLGALDSHDGAIPSLPLGDAIKRVVNGLVAGSVAREALRGAQTPQGFRFRPILEAHRAAAEHPPAADDAEIAIAAGLTVATVDGSADNFKITTAADLKRAERMLVTVRETRIGTGFDVHRFGPGGGVRLCGVDLAMDRALIGHSDADVALHALVDALLGAIAAGDIGQHFPPSDPQWRGADSRRFVEHAAKLIAAKGGVISHVDLTIICEAPRISPHRMAMVATIARMLSLAPDRVSVKATTTEGLGFAGRGEGIAAQAVATVQLPT